MKVYHSGKDLPEHSKFTPVIIVCYRQINFSSNEYYVSFPFSCTMITSLNGHPFHIIKTFVRGIGQWQMMLGYTQSVPARQTFHASLLFTWTNIWANSRITDAMALMWSHCNSMASIAAIGRLHLHGRGLVSLIFFRIQYSRLPSAPGEFKIHWVRQYVVNVFYLEWMTCKYLRWP